MARKDGGPDRNEQGGGKKRDNFTKKQKITLTSPCQ